MNHVTPLSTLTAVVIGLLVLSVAACSLLGGGDEPLPGKITFASGTGGSKPQLYEMNTDGTGLRRLTSFEWGLLNPARSPDGTKIIAIGLDTFWESGYTIHVLNADGSNLQPLNTNDGKPVIGSSPAWLPDGRRIIFSACVTCASGGRKHDIFVFDLESRTETQLTDHPAGDEHPRLSPDGTRIAFTSNRDYFDADCARLRRDIYVANADGSNVTKLTDAGHVGNVTRWGPDANTITYRVIGNNTSLFVLDVDTRESTEIETNLGAIHPPTPVGWSPDGQTLLMAQRDDKVFFLYMLDNRTGEPRLVSSERMINNWEFDWWLPQSVN